MRGYGTELREEIDALARALGKGGRGTQALEEVGRLRLFFLEALRKHGGTDLIEEARLGGIHGNAGDVHRASI